MIRRRSGFTLIEILIVVVVIGVLAAIAVPKFTASREASYYAAMRSDLTNLSRVQEMYYQRSGRFHYADSMDDLDFRLTPGVSMESLRSLDNGQAWEAVVTHASVDGGACVAGYGSTGAAAWTASGGTPAVSVTDANAGAPVCND